MYLNQNSVEIFKLNLLRQKLKFVSLTQCYTSLAPTIPLIGTDSPNSANPENFSQLQINICIEKSERRREVAHGRACHPTKLKFNFLSESLNLFDRLFGLLILSVSLWITFYPPLPPPPSLFLFLKTETKRVLRWTAWWREGGGGEGGWRAQACTNVYEWHLITWKSCFNSQSKNEK